MNYRYAYQRSGGPLLSWKHGPPRQSRAADTVALGTLADPTLVLPRPGAPEPINYRTVPYLSDAQAMGCSGCRGAMNGVADTLSALPAPVKVGGLIALAYLLHKQLKKR